MALQTVRLMSLEKTFPCDLAIKPLRESYATDLGGQLHRDGDLAEFDRQCGKNASSALNSEIILAQDNLLLQEVQHLNARVCASGAGSASLPQRCVNPAAQPQLVQQLLPRRKALIPRLCRRSAYSNRILVKPKQNEEGGTRKDSTERSFELLELGIEHVPQLCVAEMPDAEDMKRRPTPLMLTVTNPLPSKCTMRFRDCAIAAAQPEQSGNRLLSGEPLPGGHRVANDAAVTVNARLSMMDGKSFTDLIIDGTSTTDASVATAGSSEQEDSSCVVLRSGNRVIICTAVMR